MAKYQNNKIGILGGSFDPAHKGHLIISKIALRKIKLKKIYWVVTKKNPFKKKPLYPLEKRLLLARKITKNIKKINVLYLDDVVKSSRSIDVIKYILKRYKTKDIYFIIGSDILLELHKWKSWKRIVKLAKLIVFSRKGYDRNRKDSVVAKYLNNKKITFIKNKRINISSSSLRRNIK